MISSERPVSGITVRVSGSQTVAIMWTLSFPSTAVSETSVPMMVKNGSGTEYVRATRASPSDAVPRITIPCEREGT
ncbi:hypothetical protein BRD17_06890 [Halobacteriales archaeon SW_7_68_16]|nr:MAG: hypothetical protein BRD17_06890 [Halobacteriales archaeon SW_7_68_16]